VENVCLGLEKANFKMQEKVVQQKEMILGCKEEKRFGLKAYGVIQKICLFFHKSLIAKKGDLLMQRKKNSRTQFK
jgi:hypothetical protein